MLALLVIIAALLALFGYLMGKNAAGRCDSTVQPPARQPAAAAPEGPAPAIFIAASSTGVRTLAFSAPAAGETLTRGAPYDVRWEGVRFDGFAAADLFLEPAGGGEKVHVNDPKDFIDLERGSYRWNVPAGLAPGRYTLSLSIERVFGANDTPQRIAEGQSAVFTVQ